MIRRRMWWSWLFLLSAALWPSLHGSCGKVPWTSDGVEALIVGRVRADARAAVLESSHGARGRAALGEAARRLLTVEERVSSERLGESGFDVLASAGASDEILELAPRARTRESHGHVLVAALALGDVKRARAEAGADAGGPLEASASLGRELARADDDRERMRGAVLCLLGFGAAGRMALERAYDWRAERDPMFGAAISSEVALAACGGQLTQRRFPTLLEDPSGHVPLFALGVERDAWDEDVTTIVSQRRRSFGVGANLMLLGLRHEVRPFTATELVNVVMQSSWDHFARREHLDPWRVISIAQAARELATTVKGPLPSEEDVLDPQPIEDGAERLNTLAALGEVVAAVRLVQLGRVDEARAALERRLGSGPPLGADAAAVVTLWNRLGDPERALEIVRRARAADSGVTDRLDLQEALALAALGRYEEALAAALRAHVDEREATSWLVLALCHRTGRDAPRLRFDSDALMWFDIARMSTRLGPHDVGRLEAHTRPDPDVLGPMLYLVGASAVGDVEMWLDDRASLHTSSSSLTAMQAGRAEAARWRGDAAMERTWRDRRAGLLGLVTDYRSAILADLAHII